MTRLAVKDALLDAQLLRTAGSAPYGGADLGECVAAARRVRGTDLGSWPDSWAGTAAAARTLAQTELAAGRTETARLAFFRAPSYDRTAGVMLACPKEFVTFTAAEGAGDHCEAGARTLFHARAFAWLDQILQPR